MPEMFEKFIIKQEYSSDYYQVFGPLYINRRTMIFTSRVAAWSYRRWNACGGVGGVYI